MFQQRPLLEVPSLVCKVRPHLLGETVPGVSEKLAGEASQGACRPGHPLLTEPGVRRQLPQPLHFPLLLLPQILQV